MKRDANLWLVLGRGYLLQRRRPVSTTPVLRNRDQTGTGYPVFRARYPRSRTFKEYPIGVNPPRKKELAYGNFLLRKGPLPSSSERDIESGFGKSKNLKFRSPLSGKGHIWAA